MDLNLGLNIIALPMVPLISTSTGFDSLCWFLSDSVVALLSSPIRGDTTHYDAVANPAASGVLSAILKLARCETMPWKDSEGRAEWNEGPCKVIS
ncbi:hypothetical protein ACFX2C_034960 [Malus domestica]